MAAVAQRYALVRQHVLLTDDEAGQRAFYEALGFTETRDHAGGTLRALSPVRLIRSVPEGNCRTCGLWSIGAPTAGVRGPRAARRAGRPVAAPPAGIRRGGRFRRGAGRGREAAAPAGRCRPTADRGGGSRRIGGVVRPAGFAADVLSAIAAHRRPRGAGPGGSGRPTWARGLR